MEKKNEYFFMNNDLRYSACNNFGIYVYIYKFYFQVRESAAETLCGFLHCEYFKITEQLLVS